jgi:hypothetical protein
MALSRYLQINTIPELVSRLSLFFNQRFYNGEDQVVRVELFEELKVLDILAVRMTLRHYRFPPVLIQYSSDSSPTPSVMSDAKTEPISNKKTEQVSNRKAPPVAQGQQRDTSSSNSEIRTCRKKK